MRRLIYRHWNRAGNPTGELEIVTLADESSTYYYWFDSNIDLQREVKTQWSEVPDSAYVDITDACDFDSDGRLIAPTCQYNSTRIVKKRGPCDLVYFIVLQLDITKLPKKKG